MITESYFVRMVIYSYDHWPRHQVHDYKVLSEHLGRQLITELDAMVQMNTADWVQHNTGYYGTVIEITGLYKQTVEKL